MTPYMRSGLLNPFNLKIFRIKVYFSYAEGGVSGLWSVCDQDGQWWLHLVL